MGSGSREFPEWGWSIGCGAGVGCVCVTKDKAKLAGRGQVTEGLEYHPEG